jgi:Uma2 family endonuclease
MVDFSTQVEPSLEPTPNAWIAAPWELYLQAVASPAYEHAKGYYYQGHMRVETLPVSFDHGKDHVVIIFAVNLFTALNGIPTTGLDTTTFRQGGSQDCQPDVAYYLGRLAQSIPAGTGIVDLDRYPAPTLVIEVAKSSLVDDIGTKRSLYEALGVAEYWVVDVHNTRIFAYSMTNQGSQMIQASQVLPGLAIAVLEEALQRSRTTDQSQVGAWLLAQFQADRLTEP